MKEHPCSVSPFSRSQKYCIRKKKKKEWFSTPQIYWNYPIYFHFFPIILVQYFCNSINSRDNFSVWFITCIYQLLKGTKERKSKPFIWKVGINMLRYTNDLMMSLVQKLQKAYMEIYKLKFVYLHSCVRISHYTSIHFWPQLYVHYHWKFFYFSWLTDNQPTTTLHIQPWNCHLLFLMANFREKGFSLGLPYQMIALLAILCYLKAILQVKS